MLLQYTRPILAPLLPALLLFLSTCALAQSGIEQKLMTLPGLEEARKMQGRDGQPVYELYFRQPLDHQDTTKGFFQQKVYLTHKGYDQPTVLVTEGYTAPRPTYYELSQLLEANQIRVEHRYFGNSQLEVEGYDYLNLKQATADYHQLREVFATVYPEQWVSTGISKGGTTTIFYRYFYPDDVTVSVPYVAPINQEYEEQRIYDFLDKVGTEDCRANILSLQ
ncbi:MAG: S28 family serine protease, partial [Bacteroidota bacterium]